MKQIFLIALCLTLTACGSSRDENVHAKQPEVTPAVEEIAPQDAPVIKAQPQRQLRSTYPVMRGYRVDKNIEVFPLDDWQPPYHTTQ